MNPRLIGATLANRYQIMAPLGQGGSGFVYRARDLLARQTVVVKVVRDDLEHPEQVVPRFHAEARAASRIDHPYVNRVLDFGETPEIAAFLVLDLVDGPLLSHVLHAQGLLTPMRCARLLHQLARGLEAIHAGHVVHRDIKSSNVGLIRTADDEEQVMIMDFGLAELCDLRAPLDGEPTRETVGTVEYMAPEQAMGHETDPRADIYSLGVVGFEMLTGHVPFGGTVAEVVTEHVYGTPPAPSQATPQSHHIPPLLDDVVLRCLAKRPVERFQSAGEIAELLQRLF